MAAPGRAGACGPWRVVAAVDKQCLGVPTSTPNLPALFEMGRNPLQRQWQARTLHYWNKLAGLSSRSLFGCTFVANIAAGLGCGRTNLWAAELRAALQFVCPDPGWTAHMCCVGVWQQKPHGCDTGMIWIWVPVTCGV
jgi:hypothetical protein